MENKIPIAETLLKRGSGNFIHCTDYEDAVEAMIEFAKLHVEAALKQASEEAHTKDVAYTDDVEVDKQSILNSYPLTNIK